MLPLGVELQPRAPDAGLVAPAAPVALGVRRGGMEALRGGSRRPRGLKEQEKGSQEGVKKELKGSWEH